MGLGGIVRKLFETGDFVGATDFITVFGDFETSFTFLPFLVVSTPKSSEPQLSFGLSAAQLSFSTPQLSLGCSVSQLSFATLESRLCFRLSVALSISRLVAILLSVLILLLSVASAVRTPLTLCWVLSPLHPSVGFSLLRLL